MLTLLALGPLLTASLGGRGLSGRVPSPDDVLAWRGWTYLNGTKGRDSGFWQSPIPSTIPAVKAKVAAPLVWRERVFVLTHAESLVTDADGVVHANRHSLESVALKGVEDAITAVGGWITAETGGQVRFEPEVTIEPETIRAPEFGPAFLREYVGPRINGGGYVAEDKVFRGPYQGAIVVIPGAPAAAPAAWVNGTPTWAVWQPADVWPGYCVEAIHTAWCNEVMWRLGSRQLTVNGPAQVGNAWAEAVTTSELPTESVLARLTSPTAVSLFTPSDAIDPLFGPRPAGERSGAAPLTEVSLAPDPDHGQVFHLSLKGAGRLGGYGIPDRADGQPLADSSKTPTLSFDIRTTSRDPIGIAVVSRDREADYSLGRQWTAPGWPAVTELPEVSDGKWHHVALDLASLAAGANASINEVVIGTDGAATRAGRQSADPIECFLDNVAFGSEKPTPRLAEPKPDASSADPEERALFATRADRPTAALATLLGDKAELVRLNACLAYQRIKDPAAEAAIENDVIDLDPAVAEAALYAANFQGGSNLVAVLHKTVRQGITPLARATAAHILGATKNPAYGDDIISLMADRSRLCRLAAAEALAGIPGREAAIRRMTLLNLEDPEIKVAVTRSADPTDEYEMRKVLWSAVNEPSDLVRAESDIKLIQASDPEFRNEGYKGVRDDSTTTRLLLLDYLTAHPSEANRAALRLAVTDRSAKVRAEALTAFAALEKGASAEEIANVMADRDPDVQLAFLAVAKKSGIQLSEQTRQLMATSPDTRVKQALGRQ